MMTELYAIFHKPTGKYMPARMFKLARGGWTWWEPTGAHGLGGHEPEVPRLFKNKMAAKRAMYYWLKGNWYANYDTYQHIKSTAPMNPRKSEDIEIHVILPAVTRTF